jgi:hypothetical protein
MTRPWRDEMRRLRFRATPEVRVEGSPAEKPKRKLKKKSWKGWAMVYHDDDGNVIEERLRDETPPGLLEGARGLAHRAPHGDWHTVHRTGIGTSCTARGLGHRAPHGKEVYSVHST